MAASTRNQIVIDAPIEQVWEITNDVARWPQLFSEYAEANIVERHGDTVRFELVMHPEADGTVWRWVSERTTNREDWTVRAHRVETGPFEFMEIAWSYEAVADGQTLMVWEQRFHMKPTAPVDDEAMAVRINTNTPLQMALIKSKIESGSVAASGAPAAARPGA